MNTARSRAAIDWFMRLSEEDVTEAELSDWMQWCADAENLREFQDVRRTWRGFDRLGPAASELLETVLKPGSGPLVVRRVPETRREWSWAAAAAMFVAVGAAALWYGGIFGDAHRTEIAARTEMKSTLLPDGSTLALAPRTRLAVDFTGRDRNLRFASGEAYFKVRPDRQKPFVVHTAGLKVTAIGTAFDVRSEGSRVTVTVQEGLVEVSGPSGAGAQTWRIAAGNRITYDTRNRTADIDVVDPARKVAWQEGRLEYFATPLSVVVEDINRYSGRSVELGDQTLAQLEYTGSVFTGAIDDWLAGIESTFPVRVLVTREDHTVILGRAR